MEESSTRPRRESRPRRRRRAAGGAALDVHAAAAAFAAAFTRQRLHAVLIGSAAAVLQGVPAATGDLDFLFFDSPAQRSKLAAVARDLGCVVTRPYYRLSLRWRLRNEARGWSADFVLAVHGGSRPADLRDRARRIVVGGHPLTVAALDDVLRSKRAAGRER